MATKHSSIDVFIQSTAKQSQSFTAEVLNHRLAKLAGQMLELVNQAEASKLSVSCDGTDADAAAIARMKKIVAARAVRNRLFSPDLFADPTWDMMLDLAIAMAEKRNISVSSLCIAANVPTTTALRHIKTMVKSGLIIIMNDRNDGRRKYATLSQDTYKLMIKFAMVNE